MAKIDVGNGFSGEMCIAGEFVNFKEGVAETDNDTVIEQAKKAGLTVDDGAAEAKPDKDALVAEAKALGIDVKGNWGVTKLKEEITRVTTEKSN